MKLSLPQRKKVKKEAPPAITEEKDDSMESEEIEEELFDHEKSGDDDFGVLTYMYLYKYFLLHEISLFTYASCYP